MARKEEIERFINNYPDSVAVDFRYLLKQFHDGKISETEIQDRMKSAAHKACRTLTMGTVYEISSENKRIQSKLVCGND